MAEYTKIETARSIICDMCECLYPDGYCPEKCDLEKCDWMEHLKEGTADVVPVVRCKDCKYWQDNNDGYPHDECRLENGETPDPDDFCSYGERKEGAD